MVINHECGTAHTRAKYGEDVDFYRELKSRYMYEDQEFPTSDAIFWSDMPAETDTRIATQMVERKLTWKRPA